METKIAVLRGINVGGKRKILMADLKLLCEKIGMKNVATYIQSGNVIFQTSVKNSELETILEKAIAEKYGFDVSVIIRTQNQWQETIDMNPLYNESTDINHLHLTLLKKVPESKNKLDAENVNQNPDQFVIHNKNVFLSINGKYHQSKLTNQFFEKKLKVAATTRNWKTVLKISELSKNLD